VPATAPRPSLGVERMLEPQQPPAGMLAAQLTHLGLDLDRGLMRAATRAMGAILQPRQPAGLIAAQPLELMEMVATWGLHQEEALWPSSSGSGWPSGAWRSLAMLKSHWQCALTGRYKGISGQGSPPGDGARTRMGGTG
jgi:hypothetical protein